MLRPFELFSPKDLTYLSFQFSKLFDYERTWWKLYQKSVERAKLNFYVYITLYYYYWVDTSADGLLVAEVLSTQLSVLQHWRDLLDIFMLEIYSSYIM